MKTCLESAHDILRQRPVRSLESFFAPRSIAVIGATERPGAVGRSVLENLIRSGYRGDIFPINPKHRQVLELRAYPSLSSLQAPPQLAIVVTPAATVPGLAGDCARAGVPACLIISAGFKESGAAGAELERQIVSQTEGSGMRIIGPNCLGVMAPAQRLNATFAARMARPGNIAFISQSGALCTAILDWSERENFGFSAFVSIGSMLDVGWGDLIYYLGDDPATKSIVLYMESIGDARQFLSAAREVALTKPIIVIKVGRTEAAAKAAASHTGALTGSDEVLDAAFRRAGVLRVQTIAEIFLMSEVLAKQPRPRGPNLVVITNGGGPGALATDSLMANGGRLAELSPETLAGFDRILAPHWSHGNPIDLLGDASPERYAQAIELSARDPQCDGLLVILTPQAMTDASGTAEKIQRFARLDNKPILASWMGGPDVESGEAALNRAQIPTFKYPDSAARAFALMWRHSRHLRALYETPSLPADSDETIVNRGRVEKILAQARKAGRALLTEIESKQILQAYGIPAPAIRTARDPAEAVAAAEEIGFPVVLKLLSETITHKSDAGGVRLNLRNATETRHAWKEIERSVPAKDFQGVAVQPMIRAKGIELILGSSIDPQFGPVLLFGAGGQFVEIFKDRALGLPPLNPTLARRLMEETRVFKALRGARGYPRADLAVLEQLLVRFSQLVVEHPMIAEIDLNPLLAAGKEFWALDARVVLQPASLPESQWPTPAIRPYPTQYITRWKLKNGQAVLIRPIRPEDEPRMVEFHRSLSERSVYQRYFGLIGLDARIAHERLMRICFNDYDREIALVAARLDDAGAESEILGVGRLSKLHHVNEAEFALLVSDPWQGLGLGGRLLQLLVEIARREGLEAISAELLAENKAMQRLCRQAGFHLTQPPGQTESHAELRFEKVGLK